MSSVSSTESRRCGSPRPPCAPPRTSRTSPTRCAEDRGEGCRGIRHLRRVGRPCQDDPVTDRLMLLDSASLYFRAFYGVPDTVRAPDGTPVNAVRGFLDIITKLVTLYRPTHLVACWDDDWRPQWR